MNSIKNHYDNHLASVYSWMTGNFEMNIQTQKEEFRKYNITPRGSSVALDLGSGHGIQSLALCEAGFKVTAIDFNDQLLTELKNNSAGMNITAINDDFGNVRHYRRLKPELICCCGDTLAHLGGFDDLDALLQDCHETLDLNGRFFVTFRDYSRELKDTQRFIPVRADEDRILTCFLEFFRDHVRVTDILHEKINGQWSQKASSYTKLRISMGLIEKFVVKAGFEIEYKIPGRMNTLVGVRKR